MRIHTLIAALSAALLVLSIGLLTSCRGSIAQARTDFGRDDNSPERSLPLGTQINVALGCDLSSGTAHVGDAWHGTVTENVRGQNGGVIAPGTLVNGTITGVVPADSSSSAVLELAVTTIRIAGHDERIAAVAPSAVARSNGDQVVLPDGVVMSFTVSQAVALR